MADLALTLELLKFWEGFKMTPAWDGVIGVM